MADMLHFKFFFFRKKKILQMSQNNIQKNTELSMNGEDILVVGVKWYSVESNVLRYNTIFKFF